jgi:MFS family permease
MELLVESNAAVSFWRSPSAWLREKNLSSGFWTFFNAALFYDTGFAVYWFLFNLFLLDYHFNERAIGLINGALTLGLLVGTLPVGALGRKFGPRPVLLFCFAVAPLFGAARALWMWEPAQIILAFLAGLSMCTWTVTFLPAVSRLTTETNRTAAISLIFSVGVGASALGGAICGFLPQWLTTAGFHLHPPAVKRLILLTSCAIVIIGIFPVLRLRMSPAESAPEISPSKNLTRFRTFQFRSIQLSTFLWRFVLCMALWSVILAAFTPFANIYLARDLHIPLAQIGIIFSIAQCVQLAAGLLVPVVMRKLGMLNGIFATQLAAALTLATMASAHHQDLAIALYLSFSAAQWMSSPALYSLLMNETPEAERSTAAATTMFANSLVSAAATAAAGILFTQYGYTRVLVGIAASAAAVAVLCRSLLTEKKNLSTRHNPGISSTGKVDHLPAVQ